MNGVRKVRVHVAKVRMFLLHKTDAWINLNMTYLISKAICLGDVSEIFIKIKIIQCLLNTQKVVRYGINVQLRKVLPTSSAIHI